MRCTWCSDRIFNAPALIGDLPYHKICEQEYREFLDRQNARYKDLIRRGRLRVIEGGKSGNRA